MDGEIEYDPINNKLALKGVIWPAMEIFGSATAKMKRKRNQKKDQSVFENLLANSEVIEPTEAVCDGDVTLRGVTLMGVWFSTVLGTGGCNARGGHQFLSCGFSLAWSWSLC